ncbi:MAG: hypothetical protein P1U81_04530 [Verrucomicrobiales bacterium]|nr:hypothetical protein [Verrucomicrobiales bacterium]
MPTTPELQSALAANPENWELRLSLVEALVAESRHDTAVEVVNQGEALPREPGPWLDAAKCYAAVGALEQARGLVASSLEIDPEYEPSLIYQQQIEQQIAATVAPTPVALSAEDIDEEVESTSPPPPTAAAPAIVEALKSGGGSNDPIALPKVSFSSDEMDALHAAEEEAKRLREASIKRDKYNSIIITVLLHVAIFALLISVATKIPPNVPPQIVASNAAEQQEETIDDTTMEKPTVDPTTAVNTAVTDIISVSAESSLSISSLDVPVADMAMENIVSFNPSMSLGMPTSSESKMMFGQEMQGDVLGVILDVSGSMAEYLPMVVREVDKNFKDAPVVYVRNMVMRQERNPDDLETVRLIVPEEVVPYHPELKTRTPYWFLWHDLPKKAPQRYVDRLIETYKTRPNQFLADGRWDRSRVQSAIEFLMEEKIDSLYIFSDFEDFVDEDVALTIGQMLGRRKIRTYIQPAEKKTEPLDVVTKKIANRTLGRQMPTLVSILGGGGVDEDMPTSLLPPKPEEKKPLTDIDYTYAAPRPEITSPEFYGFRPGKDWTEIHRIVEPEYEAVFYGPEARAYIFLKNADGQFIQNPIRFHYHSWIYVPEAPDPRHQIRHRKFLRLQEEPSFDGKEIIWKMVLEGDLEFDVHLYLGRKGMNATYVAEYSEDEEQRRRDWAHIHFVIPALAQERSDRYFGYDFPADGVKLDDVRAVVEPNEVIFNLPRQERDRYAKGWAELGFEPGYNTRKFDELIRRLPSGIRDMDVTGPSWGGRSMSFRTTASKILLEGGQPRADIEPWESFHARLVRRGDTRERFTKTEAIEIEIK